MRAKWWLSLLALGICSTYASYPYVTMYRINQAVEHADLSSLDNMVDWRSVKEGIKEDIADLGSDDSTSNELRPFGASFRNGMMSKAVEKMCTSQSLIMMFAERTSESTTKLPISYAFFNNLTSFIVLLTIPGSDEPIRAEMDLKDGEWKVERVWLPMQLLNVRQQHITSVENPQK